WPAGPGQRRTPRWVARTARRPPPPRRRRARRSRRPCPPPYPTGCAEWSRPETATGWAAARAAHPVRASSANRGVDLDLDALVVDEIAVLVGRRHDHREGDVRARLVLEVVAVGEGLTRTPEEGGLGVAGGDGRAGDAHLLVERSVAGAVHARRPLPVGVAGGDVHEVERERDRLAARVRGDVEEVDEVVALLEERLVRVGVDEHAVLGRLRGAHLVDLDGEAGGLDGGEELAAHLVLVGPGGQPPGIRRRVVAVVGRVVLVVSDGGGGLLDLLV